MLEVDSEGNSCRDDPSVYLVSCINKNASAIDWPRNLSSTLEPIALLVFEVVLVRTSELNREYLEFLMLKRYIGSLRMS